MSQCFPPPIFVLPRAHTVPSDGNDRHPSWPLGLQMVDRTVHDSMSSGLIVEKLRLNQRSTAKYEMNIVRNQKCATKLLLLFLACIENICKDLLIARSGCLLTHFHCPPHCHWPTGCPTHRRIPGGIAHLWIPIPRIWISCSLWMGLLRGAWLVTGTLAGLPCSHSCT